MRAVSYLVRSIIRGPSTSTVIPPLGTCRHFSTESPELQSAESKDVDFVAHLKAMQPSEAFKSKLSGLQFKKLNKILPELEIYVYMGDRVPPALEDEHWKKLLEEKTVKDRVNYLEYVALTRRREERDKVRRASKADLFKTYLEEQQEKFDRGEMGYGPGMYQLVHNPFRNQKRMHATEASRIWTSMRMNYPKVVFDFQYLEQERNRDRSVLGKQMQYVLSENFIASTPLPLVFANMPKSEKATKWLHDSIGFYSGDYTHQTILPEYSDKGVREMCKGDKEIVYISRFARDMIDGPLKADSYVVCASMDHQRESLGAARRAKIRTVRLPIQKYIKWQSGPMYLPFPTLMRILREVHSNHGDWQSALLKYVAKRHLMTDDEREAATNAVSRRRERVRAKEELIQSIQDATGNE